MLSQRKSPPSNLGDVDAAGSPVEFAAITRPTSN
jgi:hypothetical protein